MQFDADGESKSFEGVALEPADKGSEPSQLLDFAAAYTLSEDNRSVTMSAAKRKRVARNRWFVAYTLIFNPSLRAQRGTAHAGASQWYSGGGRTSLAPVSLSVSDSNA